MLHENAFETTNSDNDNDDGSNGHHNDEEDGDSLVQFGWMQIIVYGIHNVRIWAKMCCKR